jgi:hypothetical protein
MTPDRLTKELSELPVPSAGEARERTVAAARAEVAGRDSTVPRSRNGTRRGLVLALAAAVLMIALLTPPGRSASAWVGELVGIGEVGGSPTLERHGFEETSNGVVIANGRAPDGTRYEWVIYDCKVDLREEGLPTRFEGFGLSLEWPDAKGREGGGSCEEAEGAPARDHDIGDMHIQILPSQFAGVAEPHLSVSGTTGPRVDRVRVVYRDTTGAEHDLDVEFDRVPAELRERVGRNVPAGTFVAFLRGDLAARDDVVARLDLRALQTTGTLELGEFARRERRQVREATRACAVHEPDYWRIPADADRETVERIMRPHRRCMDERMPPPPLEVIVYGEDGRELERWHEPIALPPRQLAPALPQGPLPWDERPSQSESAGEAIVLAGGRAPEGARYEWYVERVADRDGKVVGICTTLWWPRFRQAGAGGHCGPEMPPVSAYGRRDPEDVMAKPFGFLDDVRPASKHYMLSGFARGQVARVRVLYGPDRREAPVELTRVSGERAERMGASGPFGYWVGFAPRDARHAEFVIVSHGENGDEIGRYRYRSEVTN